METRGNHQPVPRGTVRLSALRERFQGCADFELRPLDYGLAGQVALWLCWLDGMVSAADLSEQVIAPLTNLFRAGAICGEGACLRRIEAGGVVRCSLRRRDRTEDVITDLCHGSCALVFEDLGLALCFELRSDQTRAVSEPSLEKSLKGAKDSFVENLRVNTALLRRRIASPALKLEERSLGSLTETKIALLYVEGRASPRILRELRRRLDSLSPEALLSIGALEYALADRPASPFPQFLHTERPDRFAAELEQGRIGLLMDGIPLGLLLPVNLADFLHVTGDSSNHFLVATILRALRFLALLLSALLPAFYVALARFHQEMIPTRLLLAIIEAEQGVPFSTGLEVLSMIVAFSLLQEAGLRLPNPIGDTVSIIGALIVGQAAVEAKLVSPLAIIVVALSAIACYTLPSQDLAFAVRLVRLVLVFGAIWAGLYGVGLVCCLTLLHLAELDSFGQNYTAPMSDGLRLPLTRLLLSLPEPCRRKGREKR